MIVIYTKILVDCKGIKVLRYCLKILMFLVRNDRNNGLGHKKHGSSKNRLSCLVGATDAWDIA